MTHAPKRRDGGGACGSATTPAVAFVPDTAGLGSVGAVGADLFEPVGAWVGHHRSGVQ